jgi:hypothetical protein
MYRGRNGNRWAHHLIISLERSARRCGGGFTYDKNSQRGSLMEAVELLKPYFPKGFFPAASSTYQRDLDVGRKAARSRGVTGTAWWF